MDGHLFSGTVSIRPPGDAADPAYRQHGKENGGANLDAKERLLHKEDPIPDEMLSLLVPEQKQDEAFILTGMVHSFIEPRCMENYFKAAVDACELKDVNFHALRHTFATRCVELGFDIKSLSEILGHSSENITLNRYVHPSMELKQKNMNMLSGLLAADKPSK